MTLALALCALAALTPVAQRAAAVQQFDAVAAVVNNDIVTFSDLEKRIRLHLFSLGLPDSPNSRREVRAGVLQNLILERIKVQEARKHNLTPTRAQVDFYARQLEVNNALPEGELAGFMTSNDISLDALFQWITAQIYWENYLRSLLYPRVVITQQEVDERMTREHERGDAQHYHVSEIFLPVQGGNASSMLATAQAISGLVKRNAHPDREFARIASELSQTASAAVGGDLGWVDVTLLAEELQDAVGDLAVNALSPPIRSHNGIHLLYLHAKRSGGGKETIVTLRQLTYPRNDEAKDESLTEKVNQAADKDPACRNDDLFLAIDSKAGVERPQPVAESALLPQMRAVLEPLEPGEVTIPLAAEKKLVFFQLCERTTGPALGPDSASISQDIFLRKLEKLVQKHLRDLQRSSFVEVRGLPPATP